MSAAWIPAGRDRELLLANIEISRGLGRGAIASGEDPTDVLDRILDHVTGWVLGNVAMIVPPHMIDPEEMAAAIARGEELAVEHGW